MSSRARRALACAALAGLGATWASGCVGLGALGGSGGPDAGDAAVADEAPRLDSALADDAGCGDPLADPRNCGRCGHDCLGGKCAAGACEPVGLAALGSAALAQILLTPAYVFVSTRVLDATQTGGLWRIPRAGGPAEPFVTLQKAEAMAVVGDTLYFLVNAPVGTAVDQQGGLYACAVAAAAPCSPALVAASDHPSAIAVDQGRVLYSDWTGTNSYAPPLAPTALTGLGSSAFGLFVDGSAFFFTAMGIGVGNAVASVNQLTPSADTSVKLYESISAMATPGALVGAPDALYVTMYNAAAATPSVVRRMPRIATTTPCDYGGAGNQRPYGIHIDATRIYWTNLGGGPAPPNATDGSVVSCALAGCCTTPTVHWAGQGQPSGITGDDQALYFVTNKTGFVYRVAKP